MPLRQFQSLFCERFNCPPSEYEEVAFRQCLYSHAKLFAPVLRKLKANFFAEDFKFIRYLGEATDSRDVRGKCSGFSGCQFCAAQFLANNVENPSVWGESNEARASIILGAQTGLDGGEPMN